MEYEKEYVAWLDVLGPITKSEDLEHLSTKDKFDLVFDALAYMPQYDMFGKSNLSRNLQQLRQEYDIREDEWKWIAQEHIRLLIELDNEESAKIDFDKTGQ